jgi:hypothetical protein
MKSGVRKVVAGVVVCWLAGTAIPAAAEPEDFDELIHEGVELRRRGNDVKAEEYLRKAYGLAQTPRAAAQLGLVEFALGKYADAERHLSEALASHEPWIEGHRQLLENSRTEIRNRLVAVEIVGASPDAAVALGDGRSIPLPADHVLWLLPGAVALRIETPGHGTITRSIETKPGEHVVVDVSPRAATASPSVPETSPAPQPIAKQSTSSSRLKPLGVVVGAVGVASLAAGIIAYRIAGTKVEHIESNTYHSSDLNWRTYDRLGVSLMIGGGTALAAGAALYMIGHHETAANNSIGLTPTSGGAFAEIGGTF